MINVKKIKQTYDKNGDSHREELETKEIKKPNNYAQFIKEISKSFKLSKKNFVFKIISNDDDENVINNQEDLEYFNEDAKEYMILLDENEPESSESKKSKKVSPPKEEDNSDKVDKKEEKEEVDNKEDNDKQNKDDEEDVDGDDLNKIEINVDLEITDKEIEDIFDSQFKNPEEIKEEEINDDNQFDINKFKENLNENSKNTITEFKKLFDSKIASIIEEKSKIMKTQINSIISKNSESHIKIIKEMNDESQTLKNEFDEINNDNVGMNGALGELKKTLSGIQMSEIKNPNEKPNDKPIKEEIGTGAIDILQNNIIENEEEEENKIMIKIENNEINLQENYKKVQFLEINDLNLENTGNKTFRKLYLVIDENDSSKDIILVTNSKKTNIHQLSLEDDFIPGKKGNYKTKFIKTFYN